MTGTDIPQTVRIERTRHENVRRRQLTVTEKTMLTPHMIRLVLSGDELHDFTSLAPDDHVKLFFAGATGGPDGKPAMRDYTPRRWSTEARTLTLDFAVHEAGPATAWAIAAEPGDSVEIGGPRGSQRVVGATSLLLIGDETALPAMGRWVEDLPDGFEVTTLGAVPGPADEQSWQSKANHRAFWTHRPVDQADAPGPLMDLLTAAPPRPDTFVWIAAEASVARGLRTWLLDSHGHPLTMMKARGYWTRGMADTTESF
ncbi:MAG: siderophore-interacting protein [Qingshengfaniella sp.]